MWTLCTHQAIKKVKSAGKVSWSSQGWTRTNTGCVMRYCMVIHFLCPCKWRYSCGEDKLLCFSLLYSFLSLSSLFSLAQGFLRRFRDPIRVSSIEKIIIGSLKSEKIGSLTFSLKKKPWLSQKFTSTWITYRCANNFCLRSKCFIAELKRPARRFLP